MAFVHPRPVRESANLLVGFIATSALLAAAWLGHALAHTDGDGHIWRNLTTPRSGAMVQAALKTAQTVARPNTLAPVVVADLPPPQAFQQMSPQDAVALNAKTPFSTLPNPPAAPFKIDDASADDRARALDCLTMAVYYEAGSQSDEGEAAVAQVVLNRVRHPLFPKSVCGVVLQGASLNTGCQFTFTCDGSLGRRPSVEGWKRAQRIAQRALDGYVMKSVGEATHYHTIWVVPYWQPTVVKLTEIGAHIFYRWSGGMGRPVSFDGRYAGLEPAPPAIPGLTQSDALALVQVKTDAVVAPPPAPKVVAAVAPPATVVAALAPPSHDMAQLQAVDQPQGYFGPAHDQSHRLPVANGW